MSAMEATTSTTKQCAAFLSWLNTLDINVSGNVSSGNSAASRPVLHDSIEAYYDPSVLLEVLRSIDDTGFVDLSLSETNLDDESEDEQDRAQRLRQLEGLYRSIVGYFTHNLHLDTSALPPVDLAAVADQNSDSELCSLLSLILALAVLSPSKERQIIRIQSTPEWVQRELMVCIENVRSRLSSPDPSVDLQSSQFTIPHSPAASTSGPFLGTHESLQRELRALRQEHEDTLILLKEAEAKARQADRSRDNGKVEAALRSENDRLQAEISRIETILADAETTTSRQESTIEDLKRQVAELSVKASQADELNDQVDEYKHASDKVHKLESQLEKYKKKLEEASEARRLLKATEDENLTLLERNAELEEHYSKVKDQLPLLEQYKESIAAFERKEAQWKKEKDALSYDLEQARDHITAKERSSRSDQETISLLEERVRELESIGRKSLGTEAEIRNESRDRNLNSEAADESSEGDDDLSGMANELDDALSGRTTTDLKLRIRKLERELSAAQANKADASRIVVLENLLEDSQQAKARYEAEYLSEHRDKLIALKTLEDIRAGVSTSSNDSEVATALRIRLNEATEELDGLKKSHIALEEKSKSVEKELIIARSDLALVDKDQVEILNSLRRSVSTEKEALEAEVTALKQEVAKLNQSNTMQLSQINTLLLDKVNLQSDGLTQRELMLQRAKELSTPAEISPRPRDSAEIATLRAELEVEKKEVQEVKEKLQKARNFIRQQDKLFKEQQATAQKESSLEAVMEGYKAQIRSLGEDLERQKALNTEIETRYDKEQRLMLSAWQEVGMQNMRSQVLAHGQQARIAPASWLAQQRARAGGGALR